MRYQTLGFLCVVAAIAYVQRAAISVPATEIATDLKIQDLARSMGVVQSAWYLGYALLQIPSGWVADRIGSRLALASLCVLWSALTALTGISTDQSSLMTLWFLMGAAQAGAFPCAAKEIGRVFPQTEHARASGILAGGMMIGGAIAPLITAQMLSLLTPASQSLGLFRWQLLLVLYAVPGVFWSAVFLMMQRPQVSPASLNPARESNPFAVVPGDGQSPQKRQSQDPPYTTETSPWRKMLTSGSLFLLCAQQFFRAAAMVFFLTWFPTFLQKTRGVSIGQSGLLTTLAGVGGVVGSLSGGVVSDWLLMRTGRKRMSRQGIAVVGMAMCALLITTSWFVADTQISIAIISVGVFCATFGGVSGYTVAIEFGGRQVATVFSVMNMCGNFGAMLFPITAGWLVERTGNWDLMLFFFAAIMAVDAVCWAFLNPQRPLFPHPPDVPI